MDDYNAIVKAVAAQYPYVSIDDLFTVLDPGDVINTGTPAGVALGLPDHPYLRPGQRVELEIDRLGTQRQLLTQA